MPSRIMIIIALLAAVLGLMAASAALADPTSPADGQGCRRSVVIYLDVSGSMYERCTFEKSPWSEGQARPLMENTVRFLEHSLLAPESLAVREGDRLTVLGFYSRVAVLVPVIPAFNHQRDLARIKELDGTLDFNGDKRYNLIDSRKKGPDGRYKSPFITGPEAEGKTDFATVVRDMLEVYRHTPPGDGPHGFQELRFIILTDGGHDLASTLEDFHAGMAQAQEVMGGDIAKGRVKVLFIRLSTNPLGHDCYDVGADFREKLGALDFTMVPNRVTIADINYDLAKAAKRIQIVEVDGLKYDLASRTLSAGLRVSNKSCDHLTLESVACLLRREGESAKYGQTSLPSGRSLAPRDIRKLELSQSLEPDQGLSQGRYVAELVPITSDLGPGDPVRKQLVVGPPPPPPTPKDPNEGNRGLWLLLGGGLLIVVGLVIWLSTKK